MSQEEKLMSLENFYWRAKDMFNSKPRDHILRQPLLRIQQYELLYAKTTFEHKFAVHPLVACNIVKRVLIHCANTLTVAKKRKRK